jgi:hypothetical protein
MSRPTSDARDRRLGDQKAAVIHDKGIRQVWVGCRQQTTKTQWPLIVLERPTRWETAETEHQRPDQTGSSRSDFLGHRLPPTHNSRSSFLPQ